MERLTYRDANGELWYSDNGTERDRLHRLAAYEDTGLAPVEVQQMRWIPVEERLPEPGERVLATDCGFVGEFYINKRGKWQRYNVNCAELLMALDILYWMPLPPGPSAKGEE